MVLRAVHLLGAGIPLLAGVHLIVVGVELVLLPAVRIRTLGALRTPLGVEPQKLLLLPVGAGHTVDVVIVRVPPEVLPVVGIYAAGSVVVDVAKRTELGLVVKQEEVGIVVHVVEQSDSYLLFAVSVAAERPIGAVIYILGVSDAEPPLVLGGVV